MPFTQKQTGRAHKYFMLLSLDAQFRQSYLAFYESARAHLDKRQCFSVKSHQIDFSLATCSGVVAHEKNVPEPPQIPIGISLGWRNEWGDAALKQLRALSTEKLLEGLSAKETLAILATASTPPGMAMSMIDGRFLVERPETAVAGGAWQKCP